MASLGTGGPKESTEWDDILKSKGIIPEKTQEELAEEALKELVVETVEKYDPHENKDVHALDEDLEEADSDEERILQQYRDKRIAQMRAEAMKPKFGPGVTYVSANDWKAQVTEAGEGIFVVVHLFAPSTEGCKIMDARLLELSAKFRSTKFLRCKSVDAIKNYPDRLGAFGVTAPVADDIEWALHKIGAVESEMVEPPKADAKRFNLNRF